MIWIGLITVTYKPFQFSITTQQQNHTKQYGLSIDVGLGSCEKDGMDGKYICLPTRTQKQAMFVVQIFYTQVPLGG
jgi:hypothetical protein